MKLMRSKRPVRSRWTHAATVAVMVALSAASTMSRAEAGVPVAGDVSPIDPRAMEVVQRMAERIVAAKHIRLGGEIAWDVVQSDGQTLEFGATRELVLQRPDHLRVEVDLREGGRRRLLYDGKRIVLADLQHNTYATTPQSGPVNDMIDVVSDRFGIPVALSEFLSPDLQTRIGEGLLSLRYVGESTIDGVSCDHVALRNEVGGVQMWIGREDSLPRRIAITYEHETGSPQFRARFTGWDLAPDVTDATFAFDPPDGAERIAFAPRPAAETKEEPK